MAKASKIASPKKARGVALLIVMLIMALMTTVAATMSSRMFINFNRIESQIHYQQAYWLSLSAEELIKFAIKNSFSDDGVVTLSQEWAVRDRVFPVDDWIIKGNVYDEQACFNLNAFNAVAPLSIGSNPKQVLILQKLIEALEIDSGEAEIAASSTWEYIDENNNVQSTAGVEDNQYEGRITPHVAANGLLSDVTEWRAVNGVNRIMYEKVAPFLCAIPSTELKININTLEESDAPLLVALFDPILSLDDATTLIQERNPLEGWSDVNSFLAESVFSELSSEVKNQVRSFLDVKSRFFESDIEITLNESRLRVRALLHRKEGGEVNIVRRRFGGASERIVNNTPE